MQIQNLRDFTVQIRIIDTDTIVGTGFVVSFSGDIVTCRHVVEDASAERAVTDGVKVGVYFPQATQPEDKKHTATVKHYFQGFDDDVVVLQLDQKCLPSGVNFAILGTANSSEGKLFKSYGYRRLAKYQGLAAEGKILDLVERPCDLNLQANPIQLDGKHIDSGMSGAAVLDIKRNLVIGVVAETWDPGNSSKDRDTSFAVDGLVLTFDPIRLKVEDMTM